MPIGSTDFVICPDCESEITLVYGQGTCEYCGHQEKRVIRPVDHHYLEKAIISASVVLLMLLVGGWCYFIFNNPLAASTCVSQGCQP